MKKLRPYQELAIKESWEALKKNDEPVLLMASVGAGKSLIISNILLTMQHARKRALCLVNNAELVRNNCSTFIDEGGNASIYCAALGSKDSNAPIVFGTPQSILNGINKNEPIGTIKFNLIVVDEAHAINYLDSRSCFIRILRHYKQEYPGMRLYGATGTNFRFKGTAIVGDNCLFRKQVGNITTDQLIKENYLINPNFEVHPDLVIDFSKVKIKKNGLFDQKQLELVVSENARKTELICKQVIHIMESQNRFGCFLFATTKKHAEEIYNHLPVEKSALILGDMPQDERTIILDKARSGNIKYLVNISIISVGVDIPAFDTIAYLRPTESLVLLVQTMGRVLRLSPNTGKSEALVLDFAGNIERHRDWDNPLLLEALKQTHDKDKPLVILCPACANMNTEHARRCTGVLIDKRCDYYFEFKECPNQDCRVQNDISARHCRECHQEIIDPNEKLNLEIGKKPTKDVQVLSAKYGISGSQSNFRINCAYNCRDSEGNIGVVYEHFTPISEKAKNVFYGQFVRKHVKSSFMYFPYLHVRSKIEEMLMVVNTPLRLSIELGDNGSIIRKKYFE